MRVLDLNLAITACLLSLAVFLPASAWLAERFGANRVFCAAVLMFSAGSALCGLATSLGSLVLSTLGHSASRPRTGHAAACYAADARRRGAWRRRPAPAGA